MIDQELLKYGVAGIAIWGVVIISSKAFDFAAKRKSADAPERLRAGDLSPEYYDKRFDKVDNFLSGMLEILKQLASIQSDMRDMIRDERARDDRSRHREGD